MRLEPTIEGLLDRVRAALPGVEVVWSTPWQKHGGRLMLTRPEIDAALGAAGLR